MTNPTNITNHIILVTGAASGIGKQIAAQLAAQGAEVIAADLNLEALEALKSEVNKANFHIKKVDFNNDESIITLVSEVENQIGPIKGLINCVGILGKSGMLSEDIDLVNFDLVYQINLRAALVLSMQVLKAMKPRGYGRILQLASIAGKEGNPGLVAYSVTKAGLIALVKAQGKEYAPFGITINALAPALIDTPMTASFEPEQRQYLESKIPMNRLGTVEEVASLAAWIISPACSFTTGFAFDLTGGRATY